MKKEDLFEALAGADPESVAKARTYRARRRPKWVVWAAAAACLAILAGAIWGVPALKGSGRSFPGVAAVMATYPAPVGQTLSVQEFLEGDAYGQWWQSYRELFMASSELQGGMDEYNRAMIQRLLTAQDDNTVCSPLNTYIAFAMLAETAGGNTRRQLLDLLGEPDLDTLRRNVSTLWQGNYVDTPTLKSTLGNSLWLSDARQYDEDTLNTLAQSYYASSFRGQMGSEEMNEALRAWTDDNTGGLLHEYTQNMSMDPETAFEILSTIYYKAAWRGEFLSSATKREAFHGTRGDTTVEMMHKTDELSVYRTQAFTSVGLSLADSGSMFFLLPEEGVDVNDLLGEEDLLNAVRFDPDDERWFPTLVHLSVPKFQVSARTDLLETLAELGVTDALDSTRADFTPLCPGTDGLSLSKAEHAAIVEIDEQGVTGAAYTALTVTEETAEAPPEELDFVLDRPFVFLVTGRDGSILFAGVVRNIEG